jgi:hypothetical protein
LRGEDGALGRQEDFDPAMPTLRTLLHNLPPSDFR